MLLLHLVMFNTKWLMLLLLYAFAILGLKPKLNNLNCAASIIFADCFTSFGANAASAAYAGSINPRTSWVSHQIYAVNPLFALEWCWSIVLKASAKIPGHKKRICSCIKLKLLENFVLMLGLSNTFLN